MKSKSNISTTKEIIVSSKLKKIIGAVKLPKNFNDEKELRTYFENKHTKLYI